VASRSSRKPPATSRTNSRPGTPGIPWRDIAGIGNILRHGYDSLDHAVIWGVVEAHLPPLKVAIEAMLREVEAKE
jgi:uncharacterized protein with HEPN domain